MMLVIVSGEEEPTKSYEEYMRLGDEALRAHDTKGARHQFGEAIKLKPDHIDAYYKRAIVFLDVEKLQKGVKDLDKVIELKPNYVKAMMRRAGVLIRLGELERANQDYNAVLQIDPAQVKAKKQLKLVKSLQSKLPQVERKKELKQYDQLLSLLNTIVDQGVTHSREILMKRAGVGMKLKQYQLVVEDTMKLIKQDYKDIEALYLRASAFYQMGDADQSTKHLKEILRLDPDNKQAKGLWKNLKKYQKTLKKLEEAYNARQYDQVLQLVESALSHVSDAVVFHAKLEEKRCVALSRTKKATDALRSCTKALQLDPGLLDALLARAEAKLLEDDFGGANADFHKVLELDRHNRAAAEGVDRTAKLQKAAKRKDYYKILGVSKAATKKEVRKAYRKQAMQWHPDKQKTPEDKEIAENKYRDITEAYDVLSDEDKRAIYDRGDDPNDMRGQGGRGGGGHPFQGFPFNFGGFGFGGGQQGGHRRRGGRGAHQGGG
eukprot:CAMPEP_0201544142 /NCGR_PEP_ID=MMETSP0173_2-20130828/674_1 /ASSEMBLY_ACC=CAM_ASM_000268 /TAXON_ID=218659 /ORGANISM="Vexillifera sp., Strain DIVA3 564/2" /LENGTH=490 /DNA_ID=CAMNT_0047952169 /DNA_START=52 /DNA_END=1520 /DNA_ORIENTATION=-